MAGLKIEPPQTSEQKAKVLFLFRIRRALKKIFYKRTQSVFDVMEIYAIH